MGNGLPLSGASMGVMATTEPCAFISTSTTSVLPTAIYGTIGSMVVVSSVLESLAASATAPSKRGFSGNPVGYNETLVDGSLDRRALPDVTPPDYAAYV